MRYLFEVFVFAADQKTVDCRQHFLSKTVGCRQHFYPEPPKSFALFQQKVWNRQNCNKFIHKALQLFNPKKVWTALSIA